MEQDGFFVMIYRFLFTSYAMLRKGRCPYIHPTKFSFFDNFAENEWGELYRKMMFDFLLEKELVKGDGSENPSYSITVNGIEYLHENQTMREAKEMLEIVVG